MPVERAPSPLPVEKTPSRHRRWRAGVLRPRFYVEDVMEVDMPGRYVVDSMKVDIMPGVYVVESVSASCVETLGSAGVESASCVETLRSGDERLHVDQDDEAGVVSSPQDSRRTSDAETVSSPSTSSTQTFSYETDLGESNAQVMILGGNYDSAMIMYKNYYSAVMEGNYYLERGLSTDIQRSES